MNTKDILQSRLNDNAEITNICNNDPSGQRTLNTIWSTMGKQMKVEQRTRYNALGRVEVPSDPFVYSNQDLVSFVDSIPDYADYRTGRGARVTLELIVDRDCDVGQNIVAQLRQENNEKALSNCGIPINNNIPDTIAPSKTLILLSFLISLISILSLSLIDKALTLIKKESVSESPN